MKKIMFNDKYGLTQAVLEGRKTMTRRIISPQPEYNENMGMGWKGFWSGLGLSNNPLSAYRNFTNRSSIKVDEVIAIAQSYKDSGYDSDSLDRHPKDLSVRGLMKDSAGWNNKMFVKAYACKRHIKITDVRVELLQDISDEDCLKEGVYRFNDEIFAFDDKKGYVHSFNSAQEAFSALIDKVSGKGAWERNPFVWVYEFKLFD